jgi:Flp pilus assembly protein TadB
VTFVVLFILAVVWALYLASWLRSRAQGRRNSNSIASFNKHLSVLERARPAGLEGPALRPVTSPRADVAANISGLSSIGSPNVSGDRPSLATRPTVAAPRPMTVHDAQKRRRDVLTGLAGFAVLTLTVYLLVGGPTLYLQLFADVLLAGYIGLLAYSQRLARERAEKVHYLHPDEAPRPEPALVLQSSAN